MRLDSEDGIKFAAEVFQCDDGGQFNEIFVTKIFLQAEKNLLVTRLFV